MVEENPFSDRAMLARCDERIAELEKRVTKLTSHRKQWRRVAMEAMRYLSAEQIAQVASLGDVSAFLCKGPSTRTPVSRAVGAPDSEAVSRCAVSPKDTTGGGV